MKHASLKCDICGATHSQSGKPFTPAGLGAHKAHLHGANQPPEDAANAAAPDPEAEPFLCDICGADQNARGTKFRTEKDITQHKRRIHGIKGAKNSKNTDDDGAKTEKVRKSRSLEANHVKYCPRCGFNMEIVNAAMALVTGN